MRFDRQVQQVAHRVLTLPLGLGPGGIAAGERDQLVEDARVITDRGRIEAGHAPTLRCQGAAGRPQNGIGKVVGDRQVDSNCGGQIPSVHEEFEGDDAEQVFCRQ
jgi:hypothetical protein